MIVRLMIASSIVGLGVFIACLIAGFSFWTSLSIFYGVSNLPLLLLLPKPSVKLPFRHAIPA